MLSKILIACILLPFSLSIEQKHFKYNNTSILRPGCALTNVFDINGKKVSESKNGLEYNWYEILYENRNIWYDSDNPGRVYKTNDYNNLDKVIIGFENEHYASYSMALRKNYNNGKRWIMANISNGILVSKGGIDIYKFKISKVPNESTYSINFEHNVSCGTAICRAHAFFTFKGNELKWTRGGIYDPSAKAAKFKFKEIPGCKYTYGNC